VAFRKSLVLVLVVKHEEFAFNLECHYAIIEKVQIM
jgi:hypothetical protein